MIVIKIPCLDTGVRWVIYVEDTFGRLYHAEAGRGKRQFGCDTMRSFGNKMAKMGSKNRAEWPPTHVNSPSEGFLDKIGAKTGGKRVAGCWEIAYGLAGGGI